MDRQEITQQYELWMKNAKEDPDLIKEMASWKEEEVREAFYKNLEFGTGGLRGVIGAGSSRVNIYTVAKASQGLANYILKQVPREQRQVAIGYDSRIKSEVFARTAAEVFAANGIKAFLFDRLMPTPCVSFAVRSLGCCAGVMVTASHNPSKYNGYKVYNSQGCQITTSVADEIFGEIEALDIFQDVLRLQFDKAKELGKIEFIGEEVVTNFIEEVKKQSVLDENTEVDKDVSIVYSSLHGAGLEPVTRVLRESGYKKVSVVKEQAEPDGTFPTCPYPNPEIEEAMRLGVQYAEQLKAELFLATDPDCDRLGVAVKEGEGYTLLTGNEIGVLLFDYICAARKELGTMPSSPVMIKTIVTTDMAEKIAQNYAVETINVLTGFKFIGEQIGYMEEEGRENDYIFGFEESCGYLSGTYVRDKDAVNAAFLTCEMFAFYKTRGISLSEKLKQLYDKYGYCLNTLHSYEFEGIQGFEKMKGIMDTFRNGIGEIAGRKTLQVLDYANGIDALPKSDVLKYILEADSSFTVRPSGTEPKLKAYLCVRASCEEEARAREEEIRLDIEKHLFQ
ncbi:phospho-sugar mutase [Filifactor villosus]|uniref:Phosphoglucomutase n=1 Tax=Filifactor villosus TaxID=29374 RepID=A0ABV9QMG9_9FIRM